MGIPPAGISLLLLRSGSLEISVQSPDHKSTGVFRIRRDHPEDRKESLGTRTGCGQESYSSYCYHGPDILVIVRWSRSGVLISDTCRVLSLRVVEISVILIVYFS